LAPLEVHFSEPSSGSIVAHSTVYANKTLTIFATQKKTTSEAFKEHFFRHLRFYSAFIIARQTVQSETKLSNDVV